MRTAAAAALSLGLFAATLTVLLVFPSVSLIFGVGTPILLALAFARSDWLPWAVTPALSALLLWSFSAPGVYLPEAAAAFLGWFLLGVTLLIRIARRKRTPLSTRSRRAWIATGVTSLVVIFASLATVPLDLRFALSEKAMNDVARDVIAGKRDPATIDRIGLWHPTQVEGGSGGIRFWITGTGFLSTSGFGYQRDGLIPPSYTYYKSGWYIWRDSGN